MDKWLYDYKVWDEISYPFPNLNGATVEVGNGQVISSHTLLSVWLLIHAGVKVNPRQWKGVLESITQNTQIISVFTKHTYLPPFERPTRMKDHVRGGLSREVPLPIVVPSEQTGMIPTKLFPRNMWDICNSTPTPLSPPMPVNLYMKRLLYMIGLIGWAPLYLWYFIRFCNDLCLWFMLINKTILYIPTKNIDTWWRHQMETFSALGGEFTGNLWIPLTKASDAEL